MAAPAAACPAQRTQYQLPPDWSPCCWRTAIFTNLLLRGGETGPKVGWQRAFFLMLVRRSLEAAPKRLLHGNTKP